MLIPQLCTVLSTVDQIHLAMPYCGDRFSFLAFVKAFPSFEIRAVWGLPERGSAYMVRARGRVRILVRGELTRIDQRFAVAQQIGHAVLHAGEIANLRLRGTTTIPLHVQRQQVAMFATALLCPLWAVERALPDSHVSATTRAPVEPWIVRGVALQFGVSQVVAHAQLEAYRKATPAHVGAA